MVKKQKQSISSRIVQYLYYNGQSTKAELARALSISMPTTLSAVNDLLQRQILVAQGELDSTGGRKATAIGINPDWICALGISITKNTVQLVLCDITGKILGEEKKEYSFTGSTSDLQKLSEFTSQFLEKHPDHPDLAGCGIALPGIILQGNTLSHSHVLQLENYSLLGFEQAFSLPLLFENDANAALLAERPKEDESLVFLYLGRTVGGALYLNGKIEQGENNRAGEFGHMILYPNGKTCYCGKNGCVDPYCSISALTGDQNSLLETFMEKAHENSSPESEKWQEALDALALLCSNLRMAFNRKIVLGGPLSRYLRQDLDLLKEKTAQYDLFEHDASYLFAADHFHAAAAIGAAELFFLKQIQSL